MNSDGILNTRRLSLISTSVLSQIFSTIATFLPIKAALVAVGGGGRDFFPEILTSLGPAWSSLTLVALAIASGILSRFLENVGQKLTVAQALRHTRDPEGIREFLSNEKQTGADRIIGSVILLVVFLSVGFVVNALQVVLVVVATVALFLRHFVEQKKLVEGEEHRDWSEFGTALKTGSIWISVGAAILGVLSSFSQVTVTQLLVGIVVTRKAMMIFPTVISGSRTEAGSRRSVGVTGRTRSSRRSGGKDVAQKLFSKTAGEPEVSRILELQHPTGTRILQLSGAEAIGFVSRDSQSDKTSISRVFPISQRVLAERERLIVESIPSNQELSTVSERLRYGKNFVSFAVFPHGNVNTREHQISNDQAFLWQLKFEKWWTESNHPGLSIIYGEEKFPQDLREKVRDLVNLPGPHSKPLQSVLNKWDAIIEVWSSGAPALGFSGGVSPKRLFAVDRSSLILIDAGGWRVGPRGADWPAKGKLPPLDSSLWMDAGLNELLVGEALMRRDLRSLSRAVDMWDFRGLSRLASRLSSIEN